MELNQSLLKHFRELSEKLAKQKELIVKQSWHYSFTNVLQEISNKRELSQVLYETQAEFFAECVTYRNINNQCTRSTKSRFIFMKF